MDLSEKLDFLLKKYGVMTPAAIDGDTVLLGENKVKSPILQWRSERRFAELKKLSAGAEGISVMRVTRIAKRNEKISDMLYREADLCEWILGTRITEIFAVKNEDYAMNAIAKTEAGYLCTLELAATLNENAETDVIDKHEIITRSGVICDRVTDTLIPQQSIYVYADKPIPDAYTDCDAELYGLSADDAARVRRCFDMAQKGYTQNDDAKRLSCIVCAAEKSAVLCENIKIEEVSR